MADGPPVASRTHVDLRGVTISTLVVVPAYNEEAALPTTLDELRTAAPGLAVLVVDDGSRDRTAEVARAAGAVTIRLEENAGVGAAVRTGLQYTRDHAYDRAIVVDADGQHDAAGISNLLAALDAGADVAIGSRFAPGAAPYEVSWVRRNAMRLLTAIVRRVTHTELSDVTSGFRAFDAAAIAVLAERYPADYLGDTVGALLIAASSGLTLREVPTSMRPRQGGTASTRHVHLARSYGRLLWGIASGRFRHAPGAP